VQGLEDVIGLSVVHPTWQRTRPDKDEHVGWTFASPDDPPFKNPNGFGSFPATDCIPDTVNNAKFIRDLYEMTGQDPGVNPLLGSPRQPAVQGVPPLAVLLKGRMHTVVLVNMCTSKAFEYEYSSYLMDVFTPKLL
jgi:hypothetical protein